MFELFEYNVFVLLVLLNKELLTVLLFIVLLNKPPPLFDALLLKRLFDVVLLFEKIELVCIAFPKRPPP